MRRLLPPVALLAAASCSAPQETAPAPPPAPPPVAKPQPAPPPSLAANWEDRAATPGTWAYRQDSRGSLALFGPEGRDALFVLRCDRQAGKVFLSRSGTRAADDPLGAMLIRASSGVKSLPAQDNGGTPPYVAASLPPADPHLDAMAFSRGKFMVSVKGQSDLIIPAWAEVTRIIEDCRG